MPVLLAANTSQVDSWLRQMALNGDATAQSMWLQLRWAEPGDLCAVEEDGRDRRLLTYPSTYGGLKGWLEACEVGTINLVRMSVNGIHLPLDVVEDVNGILETMRIRIEKVVTEDDPLYPLVHGLEINLARATVNVILRREEYVGEPVAVGLV
jgi:hypothetical protein